MTRIRAWISILTVRRIFNLLLLRTSYILSKAFSVNWHAGLPVAISVEPTTACNLRCPECPSGLRQFTRATGNLKMDLFEKTIEQLSPHLMYLNFYFQGEPFIHPELTDMISYAVSRKIYTVTSTNAHFMSPDVAKKVVDSGLNEIIISVDGTTQETYAAYRIEGKLDRVLQGAANLVEAKRKNPGSSLQIIFQFLVVAHNEDQIDSLYRIAAEYGIDEVRLKTAQINDYKNGSDLIPSNSAYSRYIRNNDGTWSLKNKLENHCWRMWSGCVMTWDGVIVPCCFDKDAKYRMGSLKTHTFGNVWRSKPYKQFRNQLLRSRKEIDICTNCTEGSKVFST